MPSQKASDHGGTVEEGNKLDISQRFYPNFEKKPQLKTDLQSIYNEIQALLEKYKLSKKEISIFLHLIRFGPLKVQELTNNLDFARTELYNILRVLESRGLIYRTLEKPYRFSAVPLKRALEILIEEERSNLNQLEKGKDHLLTLWRMIPQPKDIVYERELIQVVDGRNRIGVKICELVEKCEESIRAVISDSDFVWIYNSPFFEKIEKKVKKNNIDSRIMIKYSVNSTYLLEKLGHINFDYAFTNIELQNSFFISDFKEIVLVLDSEERRMSALATNYASLIRTYINYVELMWKYEINS